MQERNVWTEVIGAIFAAWVVFTLFFVAVAGWPAYLDFLTSPAAAWVQALGSIGAIWGSLKAARFQFEMQQQAAKVGGLQRQRAHFVSLLSSLQFAEAMALKVRRATEPGETLPARHAFLMRIELQGAQSRLEQLPTHEYSEWPRLVEAHSVGIAASAALVAEAAGYLGAIDFGHQNLMSLHESATILATHFQNSARNVAFFLQQWDSSTHGHQWVAVIGTS